MNVGFISPIYVQSTALEDKNLFDDPESGFGILVYLFEAKLVRAIPAVL